MNHRLEEYQHYINSNHWASLRELKFELQGRRCQCCDGRSGLQVHHLRYKNLVDCCPADLAVLCKECHEILHIQLRIVKMDVEQCSLVTCCELIIQFKASPDYKIRKQNIKERAAKKKASFVSPNLVTLTNPERRIVKRLFSAMQADGYKTASVKELSEALKKCVSRRTVPSESES